MRHLENRDFQALARLMQKRKDVVLAYIFGSQVASNQVKKRSRDIDIAVLFDPCPSFRDLLRFRSEITWILKTDRVDLISLSEAPPLLRYEIVSGGRTIYARDSRFQSRFEMNAISRFLDTQHLRTVQNRYLL